MGRPNVTATPSMLIYPELLKNEEVSAHLATACSLRNVARSNLFD